MEPDGREIAGRPEDGGYLSSMSVTPEIERPGLPSKPLTIREIAETLGIHKSTVSFALSGKGRVSASMREKILKLADDLGYEPDPVAQRLASRSKSRLVCLCSDSLDSGRGTEKIGLIQQGLTGLGLEVPFYTPPQSPGDASTAQISLFRQLRRQRPQAIVCSVHTFHEDALAELQNYQREGGVVVTYDLPVALDCDQVVFDRVDNAYQGARYLLQRGHHHLGLGMSRLAGAAGAAANTPQALRAQGFQKALSEWGEHVHSEWLFENPNYERGGAAMARHFLELPLRPTGLCIVNDYVALAFMVELMRAGVRVPEDVSIVGHDDQPVASHCPVPLTSVSQPAEEIVDTVVKVLSERLEGATHPARTYNIRGTLIERQSVASIDR